MLGRNAARPVLCWCGGVVVLGLLVLCVASVHAQPILSSVPARPNGGWGAVWSPKGDRIAFLSSDDGLPPEVWVCDAQGKGARRLTHGGADDPVWSADGRSLTFASNRRGRAERWQVGLDSSQESPQTMAAIISSLPAGAGAIVSPDGKSVAYTLAEPVGRDLYLATGSAQPQRITNGFRVSSVAWSPKGDRIAFDGANPLSKGLPQVWLYDLTTKRLAHIGSPGSFGPVWSPRGNMLAYAMLYSGQNKLVAVASPDAAFVLKRPKPAGKTTKVAGVEAEASAGRLVDKLLYQGDGMAWSPTADLLAVVVRAGGQQQVRFVNSRGKIVAGLSRPGLRFRLPAWSPDGRLLAFEAIQTGVSSFSEVWVTDIKGKRWRNLTPSRPSYWALSPAAGGRVFFLSTSAGVVNAWAAQCHSAAAPAAFPDTDGATAVVGSPASDRAVVLRPEQVALFSADGKSLDALPLTGAVTARWSPQGDRLAIGLLSEAGEDTIKLFTVSAEGKLAEIASVRGANPAWRRDGQALAYVQSNTIWRMDGDGKDAAAVASVPVAAGEQALVLNPAWGAKGETIAFAVARATTASWRQELWLLPADGASPPTRVYAEDAATEYAFSPARWAASPMWTEEGRLLFASDRGGTPQVWSVRADGSDLHAITPAEAVWPALGPDGLYFIRLDSDTPLWKVLVDGSDPVPVAWKN